MTLRTTTTATTTPNLIATPSNSTFFVTLSGKNPHNDLIKSRRLSPPARFPSPNTSLNHGPLSKRHRFIPKARSSSLSEAVELPLLPFPMDQVLVPSESRTLHLYEARYLALLDKIQGLRFKIVVCGLKPRSIPSSRVKLEKRVKTLPELPLVSPKSEIEERESLNAKSNAQTKKKKMIELENRRRRSNTQGEGITAIPVIKCCIERRPDINILMTITTLSAFTVIKNQLPSGVIYQVLEDFTD